MANVDSKNFVKAIVVLWVVYELSSPTDALSNSTIDAANRTNILVISRVNSGSSFVSEFFQAWDNLTFYDFEPLFKTDQRSHTRLNRREHEVIKLLTSMMKCDYSAPKRWLNTILRQKTKNFLSRNTMIFKELRKKYPDARRASKNIVNLFNERCNQSRVHLMKVLRFRMVQVGRMMDHMDPELRKTLKVILLIRDPRGTYNSRGKRGFCSGSCSDITQLCNDVKDSIREYVDLKANYRDQVFILRYEDVSENPDLFVKNFFPKALNFTYNQNLEKYIATHTIEEGIQRRRHHSTIRVSKSTTFKWSQELPLKKLMKFDSVCVSAFRLGGYKFFKDALKEGKDMQDVNWLMDVPQQLRNFLS